MEAIRDIRPRLSGDHDTLWRDAVAGDTVSFPAEHRGYAIDRTWPRSDDLMVSDADADGVRNVLSVAAYQLLARARQLSVGQATDRQMAIIFGVSACEMHTEQALTRLLKTRGSKLRDVSALVGHPISLDNPRVQKVYTALTHDIPWGATGMDQPPARWWQDWLTSRELKQDVARDGRAVSPAQAGRCMKTAVSYLAHVSEAVAKALAVIDPRSDGASRRGIAAKPGASSRARRTVQRPAGKGSQLEWGCRRCESNIHSRFRCCSM